ncbi:ARL14 effector protein-like [Uloborus diversus]|uniref:ARL14 effector protein-like n=1 Tax=Uloborus diversus TaxID=327109 RepID=UPI0024096745|nr:ARL14 effector protein-like [Uloborus diversus]
METCSVGEVTHSDCHLLSFVKKKDTKSTKNLSESELTLLKLRTGASNELKTICLHHQCVYLQKYEFLQKCCCDPFERHKSSIQKGLRIVTLELSRTISAKGFQVKPGQKLCANCRNKFSQLNEFSDDIEKTSESRNSSEEEDDGLNLNELKKLQKKKTNRGTEFFFA